MGTARQVEVNLEEQTHMKPADNARTALEQDVTKLGRRASESEASAKDGVPVRFRLLKWNEVVRRGDFVADECQGFELWEGPAGFRADSFLKPIYRQDADRSIVAKK